MEGQAKSAVSVQYEKPDVIDLGGVVSLQGGGCTSFGSAAASCNSGGAAETQCLSGNDAGDSCIGGNEYNTTCTVYGDSASG